jgi:hypothetical protein
MQNLIIEAMRLLDEGVTVTERILLNWPLINELFEGRTLLLCQFSRRFAWSSVMINRHVRPLNQTPIRWFAKL